jgi:hypothetical protein
MRSLDATNALSPYSPRYCGRPYKGPTFPVAQHARDGRLVSERQAEESHDTLTRFQAVAPVPLTAVHARRIQYRTELRALQADERFATRLVPVDHLDGADVQGIVGEILEV